MHIIINGEDKTVEENITLQKLLQEFHLEGKVMAAAINMEIIKQNKWNEQQLHEGDKLELLDFVGGG